MDTRSNVERRLARLNSPTSRWLCIGWTLVAAFGEAQSWALERVILATPHAERTNASNSPLALADEEAVPSRAERKKTSP